MALDRSSSARWEGDLQNGKGQFEVGDGVYVGSYTFASRFESGDGTNPEELIAAAHAACYSMALSNVLAKAGHTPDAVETDATVTLDPDQGVVTKIHLVTRGAVPGIDEDAFLQHAAEAKDGCPISKTLAAVEEITLDAALA